MLAEIGGHLSLLSNVDFACTNLSDLLQVDPCNAKALFLRGNSLFKKHEYAAALEDFSASIRSDATNIDCIYNRGGY